MLTNHKTVESNGCDWDPFVAVVVSFLVATAACVLPIIIVALFGG